MADIAHNVIRINGSLPGGEVWSISPKFGPGALGLVDTYADLQEWCENVAALYSGDIFPTQLRGLLSASGAVVSIRAEYRLSNRELITAAEYTLPAPVAGTGGATKPFQTSLVISLMTGRPGRSYRGRLYFPALAAALDGGTLRIPEVTLGNIVEASGDWLSQVESASGVPDGPKLAVVSELLGVATPVNTVGCGDVLDVQRRRRDSVVEGRQSRIYPPT